MGLSAAPVVNPNDTNMPLSLLALIQAHYGEEDDNTISKPAIKYPSAWVCDTNGICRRNRPYPITPSSPEVAIIPSSYPSSTTSSQERRGEEPSSGGILPSAIKNTARTIGGYADKVSAAYELAQSLRRLYHAQQDRIGDDVASCDTNGGGGAAKGAVDEAALTETLVMVDDAFNHLGVLMPDINMMPTEIDLLKCVNAKSIDATPDVDDTVNDDVNVSETRRLERRIQAEHLDVPLELTPMSWRDALPLIKPFDFYGVRSTGRLANLIGIVQGQFRNASLFTHGGTFVTTEVLQLPGMVPGKLYILEAILQGTTAPSTVTDVSGININGVNVRDFEAVMDQPEDAGNDWITFWAPLNAEARAKVEDFIARGGSGGGYRTSPENKTPAAAAAAAAAGNHETSNINIIGELERRHLSWMIPHDVTQQVINPEDNLTRGLLVQLYGQSMMLQQQSQRSSAAPVLNYAAPTLSSRQSPTENCIPTNVYDPSIVIPDALRMLITGRSGSLSHVAAQTAIMPQNVINNGCAALDQLMAAAAASGQKGNVITTSQHTQQIILPLLGKPYPFNPLNFMASILPWDMASGWSDAQNASFFCSELIAWLYLLMGVISLSHVGNDPRHVFPVDFCGSIGASCLARIFILQ